MTITFVYFPLGPPHPWCLFAKIIPGPREPSLQAAQGGTRTCVCPGAQGMPGRPSCPPSASQELTLCQGAPATAQPFRDLELQTSDGTNALTPEQSGHGAAWGRLPALPLQSKTLWHARLCQAASIASQPCQTWSLLPIQQGDRQFEFELASNSQDWHQLDPSRVPCPRFLF